MNPENIPDDYPAPVLPDAGTDWAPSEVTPDIKTSALPDRLAEDGPHVRSYSAILHDKPVREVPAVTRDGKRFGTNLYPESLSLSLDNARVYLAALYGFDVADSMLMQALTTGNVINGGEFKVVDTQYKTRGRMSVTTDKSRPGEFTLMMTMLRQSGGRKK